MTDLPDVVTNRMGGGSARQSHVFSVLSARAYKYVVFLPISTDSLLIM